FFNSGQGFYRDPWLAPPTPIETRAGLGPLCNAHACADCHLGGGRGRPPLDPGGAFVGLVLRLGSGARDARGAPEPDDVYGDQLQTLGVEGVPAEGTPTVSYRALADGYPEGTPFRLGSPTYGIEHLQYGPTGAPLA